MVMAQIYTIAGKYDDAIDQLEYLLSIPSWCTPEFIRADPIFAPLQDIPRLKKILRDYEPPRVLEQLSYR
jgi:hypothetical protein